MCHLSVYMYGFSVTISCKVWMLGPCFVRVGVALSNGDISEFYLFLQQKAVVLADAAVSRLVGLYLFSMWSWISYHVGNCILFHFPCIISLAFHPRFALPNTVCSFVPALMCISCVFPRDASMGAFASDDISQCQCFINIFCSSSSFVWIPSTSRECFMHP